MIFVMRVMGSVRSLVWSRDRFIWLHACTVSETGTPDPRAAIQPNMVKHRVGVAFSEGPKLLPFYENLVKWQLLPLYAHILSVTFTVLPQTHNRERRAQPRARRGVALVGVGERLSGRMLHFRRSASRCVGHAMQEYRTVKSPVHELHSRSAV